MIDRIDAHPTTRDVRYVERRSGKDRRKIHTMIDPQFERRKGPRRRRAGAEETPFFFFMFDEKARV